MIVCVKLGEAWRELAACCLASPACHWRDSQLLGEFALQLTRGSWRQLFRRLTCRNDHLQLRDGNELMRTSRQSAAQACVEIAGVCAAVEVCTCMFVSLKDTLWSSFLSVQQTSLQLHWLLSNMFFPLAVFKCGLRYFLRFAWDKHKNEISNSAKQLLGCEPLKFTSSFWCTRASLGSKLLSAAHGACSSLLPSPFPHSPLIPEVVLHLWFVFLRQKEASLTPGSNCSFIRLSLLTFSGSGSFTRVTQVQVHFCLVCPRRGW